MVRMATVNKRLDWSLDLGFGSEGSYANWSLTPTRDDHNSDMSFIGTFILERIYDGGKPQLVSFLPEELPALHKALGEAINEFGLAPPVV